MNGTLAAITQYTQFTVPNLAATSASTTLTFLGRQDTGWNALANVSVESSAVPEPATLLLTGAALCLLGAVRRKER